MPKSKKYKKLQLLGNIFFWTISVGFWILLLYVVSEKTLPLNLTTALKALIPNIGFAAAVYINLYLLIPRFLKEKNYIYFFFWLILLLSFSSILIQAIFIFPFRYFFSIGREFTSFNTNLYSAYFFATFLYVGLTSFLKFIRDWFVLQDLNLKYEQIERQKLEAELKTLKGQINPHFLFNSLNNIYSLALTQSEKVPDLILRLSDLMRHIIYDSRENFIYLSKEIEFVENYISLQKIRISSKATINYNIEGPVSEKKIAPLLFEPFIDNAFKHGLNNSNGKAFINIKFHFKDSNTLNFIIENSFEEPLKQNPKYKGIGLTNVEQRLSRLYKPNEYKLTVSENNHVFKVELELKLK